MVSAAVGGGEEGIELSHQHAADSDQQFPDDIRFTVSIRQDVKLVEEVSRWSRHYGRFPGPAHITTATEIPSDFSRQPTAGLLADPRYGSETWEPAHNLAAGAWLTAAG